MFRDIAAAHPRGDPIGPSNADRDAGRDWGLTILTDAQVAAQPFDFRAETRLGVAAQALALVGALEFQDGRADNAFAETLAMNMLEVEGQFAPNNLALLASARKLSGAGAIPTGAAFGPPNATVRIARARPASRTREYTARRPRDLHGAARGVRVKLEFSAPYWSLDQAKAWALTRHPEPVSWAAKPANFKGAPVALAARIGLYLERARRQGQTSTRNSGAQAAGRLLLNRLRRGTTSRKALATMDLMNLRGRSSRKAMKVLSRDSLSFQSKTTSFSFFGPEGSNPWENGQVKGGIKSYQQPTGWGSKLLNWLASAWPSRRQPVSS
jgi:hypothetical protein